MLTVISGTNRPNSMTELVADVYNSILSNKQVEHKYLKLTQVPHSFLHDTMYAERIGGFKAIQDSYIKPADKFIIISPEYNGSIPGFLKLFIDACEIKPCYHGKKACLTGVASGRAGNLRGLDHLTNILNHIKMKVYYNKLPISTIGNLVNEKGNLNTDTRTMIEQQIDEFIGF